jgi:hypothetical protein
VEKVLVLDKKKIQHSHNIKGRIDQYLVIKELCQKLNISNTVTPFELNSSIFGSKPDVGWQTFMIKAQHAFNLGNKTVKSNQALINIIRLILNKWSGTNLGDGERKKNKNSQNKTTVYTLQPSKRIREILPLLKSLTNLPMLTLFDKDNPQPINGMSL